MKVNIIALLKSMLTGLLLMFFSYKMFYIILPYTTWVRDIDFLITKQEIIHLAYYRLAFYGHIFSSLIILISGIFLFSPLVLKIKPRFHRFIGKTYVFLVLLISAPTGLVMAFHANGEDLTKLSFIILSILWWVFTYKGYVTARNGNYVAHRRWMTRSYALTLSAITLRILQVLLTKYTYLDPSIQYFIISWSSWIFNLLVVEISFNFRRLKNYWQLKMKDFFRSKFYLSKT